MQERLTYNAIFDTYGEEIMLVYENLVDCYIKNKPVEIKVLQIANLSINLDTAQRIIDVAKKHAKQEIKDAARCPVPTKSLLTEWKATALIMWQEYALLGETPDLQDIRKFLKIYGHNQNLYTQAYHELYTELVAIEVIK